MLLASGLLWLGAAEPEPASLEAGWLGAGVGGKCKNGLTRIGQQWASSLHRQQDREALLFGNE